MRHQNRTSTKNPGGSHIFNRLWHTPDKRLKSVQFYGTTTTLRHDRMDNFWFTIVHELAHLYLHLDGKNIAFFDNTEQPVDDPGYPKGNEANAFTSDILFLHEVWEEGGT